MKIQYTRNIKSKIIDIRTSVDLLFIVFFNASEHFSKYNKKCGGC